MKNTALIIGSSDGIGLAATKHLLEEKWTIAGISKSPSPIENSKYNHIVADVRDDDFSEKLNMILQKIEPIEFCIYCAGIGELLDFSNMEADVQVIIVNLLGMVKTCSLVIPSMLNHQNGHFIGISSFADELLSDEAPAYHSSKAGFSSYLESLALA